MNKSPYDPTQTHHHPFENLPELARARLQIHQAIKAEQHILIYGDYDCDGIVSVTLMRDLLLACGAVPDRIHCRVPHRIIHGYGICNALLEGEIRKLDEQGEHLGLAIAVDCGTNEVKALKELLGDSTRILVLDHHKPSPEAIGFNHPNFAIINPKLWLDAVGQNDRVQAGMATKDLCAAGLVYLLAIAIAGRKPKWNRDRALLLAGLATCVDVMPLHGINRRLLKVSLLLANDPDKLKLVPGLYLMARRPRSTRAAPLPKEIYYPIDEETYGFDWGPCLNAPGRMSVADTALNLLAAEDEESARKLVAACRAQNNWRQATTAAVTESALVQAKNIMVDRQSTTSSQRSRTVLLLRQADWHPGVVGIVASRIKDIYHRPTFVCTKKPDGGWTGSGRSVKLPGKTYDMGDKLQEAKADKEKWLAKGGGHEMAGGMSFWHRKRLGLPGWLDKNSGLNEKDFILQAEVHASASVLEPAEWGSHFKKLQPFGNDNPCPYLLVERAALLGIRVRTRVRGDIKNRDREDGYGLGEKTERPKFMVLASPRPEIWAYEGEFYDLATERFFFAHWLDLEMAEYLWEINDYFHYCLSSAPSNYKWRHDFKLELELRSFVPSMEWSKVEPGQVPKLAYNFQIRQCGALEPLPAG